MYKIDDIPIGSDNAITRKNLAAIWNVSDRMARRIVAELRAIDDGTDYVIVSVSRGRGYYRTQNICEINHFMNEMRKRIRNTYKAIRVAQRIKYRLERKREYGGEDLAG